MKILIMGLPGSGKTTLAARLKKKLNAEWINADDVRKENNDWDFSDEGVLRQSKRMGKLAEKFKCNYVIADFICPFEKGRELFGPDYIIWMDTVKKGRYPTFDKTFEIPRYNFRVQKKEFNIEEIILDIKKTNLSKTKPS